MAETVRTDVVISAIDKASAPLKRICGGFNMLSKQGLMAGAMFAGVTIGIQAAMSAVQGMIQWISESVNKYREFTKTMAEVSTMLDEVGMEQLPMMTRNIELMSLAFGKSVNDLGQGLYQVLSAGVDAADAMMVLRNSAKLAAATMTGVETSVDAVTTVLNAYGMSAYRSAEVSTIFANTVVLGKVRMEELAAAIGYVVPMASQAGIGFNEVAAAIATLSKQGISAQKSSRGLRQVFTQLLNPSEEAVGAMVDMGIAYDELVIEGRGLGNVMQMINEATGGSVAEMSRLIPNTQALSAALALNAQDGNLFVETLKSLNEELDSLDKMYNKVTQSADFKMKQDQMMGDIYSRLVGEDMEPFNREIEKVGRVIKKTALDWTSFIIPLAWAANAYTILKDEIDTFNEAMGETNELMDSKIIEEYTAVLTKYNEAMDDSNDFIRRTEIAMTKVLDVEIPHLEELKRISAETYTYNTSLRFLNAALKDSAYNSYLHESSTLNLVNTIRSYKDELEALNTVQRSYNRETSVNSIAMMKIQVDADSRRRGATRGEKQRLKEIGIANTQLRIKTAENALAMVDIQEKLSPAQKELELVRLAYQEQLFIIQDTYAQEQKALQDQIDYKQGLFNIYEQMVIDHYLAIQEQTVTHINKMNALAAQNPAAYISMMAAQTGQAPGSITNPNKYGWTAGAGAYGGGGGGGNVHVEPITINVNTQGDAEQVTKWIQQAISSGFIGGDISTVYG